MIPKCFPKDSQMSTKCLKCPPNSRAKCTAVAPTCDEVGELRADSAEQLVDLARSLALDVEFLADGAAQTLVADWRELALRDRNFYLRGCPESPAK